MKNFNFQGVNFNLSAGFSVSIDGAGTMSIVKDVPQVVPAVATPVLMIPSTRYESNSVAGLKWGDVMTQCRRFNAVSDLTAIIKSHDIKTVHATMNKLGASVSIEETNAYEYTVTKLDRTQSVTSQVANFTDIGQTLAIRANSIQTIRSALYLKELGANVEKTPHKEWFVVTSKPIVKYNKA